MLACPLQRSGRLGPPHLPHSEGCVWIDKYWRKVRHVLIVLSPLGYFSSLNALHNLFWAGRVGKTQAEG